MGFFNLIGRIAMHKTIILSLFFVSTVVADIAASGSPWDPRVKSQRGPQFDDANDIEFPFSSVDDVDQEIMEPGLDDAVENA